jgi:hypothetical protein
VDSRLDAVADELYSLAPEDFVAVRNARQKEVRADGDKETAAQIGKLTKPSVVAWLGNQLAREHRDEIESLLELGEALRHATAALSGEALRELSRQQRELVQALVRQAKRLAEDSGRRVNLETERGLADTLHAALADPEAAALLVSGRLTVGLQSVGFGAVGVFGAGEEPSDRVRAGSEDAAGVIAEAKDAVLRTTAARDQSLVALEDAERAAQKAAGVVVNLRADLDRAVAEQSRAERDERMARESLDEAEEAVRKASAQLANATMRSGATHSNM